MFMKKMIPLLVVCGLLGGSAWAGRAANSGRQAVRGWRREGKLKVGDPAPDFTLQSPDGKKSFTLSAFKGKKPVVLVFGSYT